MAKITLAGNSINTKGNLPSVGSVAPDFSLVKTDLSELTLAIRNLLFLGKASEQKLLNQGIRTIGDLAKEREANVQLWLGEKPGHQLWKYARGIDDSTVKAVPDEAKGFSVETTFNDDITSTEQVLPILLEQCDVLATRMRRKDKKCNCISVTFRTLDFRNRSHQTKLENATG